MQAPIPAGSPAHPPGSIPPTSRATMLAAGVAALSALVPTASTEACASAIDSLLRRYTTGLSLSVAADELERVPPSSTPAIYRGRVTHVSVAPLLTWHVAGTPCVLLYAHSRLSGVQAVGSGVRLRAQEASSLSDSPASVVAAARRSLGDARVVVNLPKERRCRLVSRCGKCGRKRRWRRRR